MSTCIKLFTLCLLSITVVACGGRSINAPIDSRSNNPEASSRLTNSTVKTGRSVAVRGATQHTVKGGETLYAIAREHDMEFWRLASINGIRPPYTIYKGQRLSLREKPGAKTVKSKARPAASVVIKKPATAAAGKTTKIIKFNGKWKWPTRGRLLRGFKPNETGKKGINIGGHRGQPVKAAASGKVVYVGSGLVGYGRLIIIRHNEKLLSTYGHNSKLLVADGEYVKSGQMIAKMGSSGTDRAELYFEIRNNGKPVNPLSYLPVKH